MSALEFHPLASIFPLLDGADFDALAEDIRQNGQREPIKLYDGMILDGRNRYRACEAAGVDARLESYDGADPAAYVISLNLRRRHLDTSQRAMVAAKLANIKHGGDRRSHQAANLPLVPQPQAAEMLNVSERSVRAAVEVRDNAVPELALKVEQGEVSVSAAADVSTLPKPEQQEIVARGEAEILEAAKQIRTERAERRRAETTAVAGRPVAVPEGKFGTVIIDPPWAMQKIERDVRPNQVEFDYPTMSEEQLREFASTVEQMCADNVHGFVWTTQKFLPLAIQLIEAWGFRYVLTMVWHKPGGFQPIGLPQYNCEFVVYGRKGSPTFTDTKAFNCCFEAGRREHSRKPDEFYDLIRRVTEGPRIDVFSREAREGFAQFGNEASKFAEVAA